MAVCTVVHKHNINRFIGGILSSPLFILLLFEIKQIRKNYKIKLHCTIPSSYRHLGPLLGLETVRELVLEDVRDDAPGDGHAGVELEHVGPPRGGVPDRKPPQARPRLRWSQLGARSLLSSCWFILFSYFICTELRLRHRPLPHVLGACEG